MSHQRWHEWTNKEDTTCPPFGVILLYGGNLDVVDPDSQVVGTRFVLSGFQPEYDVLVDELPAPTLFHRGLGSQFAFNGPIAVEPGRTGLCTQDLPTWVALTSPADEFGKLITLLYPGWLASPATLPDIFDNTACLRLLASVDGGNLAYVGNMPTFGIS